jgi:CHASE3 domain sensor protein
LLFPNISNEEVYDSNLDFNVKSSEAVQSEGLNTILSQNSLTKAEASQTYNSRHEGQGKNSLNAFTANLRALQVETKSRLEVQVQVKRISSLMS